MVEINTSINPTEINSAISCSGTIINSQINETEKINTTVYTTNNLNAEISNTNTLNTTIDFVNNVVDCFVKVTGSDATADVLYNKISAGSNTIFTVLNPTGSETLRVDVAPGSLVTNAATINGNLTTKNLLLPDTVRTGTEGIISFGGLRCISFPLVNTYIGDRTGNLAGSGMYNIAIGRDALYSANNGDYNVAIGVNALKANTLGTQNMVIGTTAMTFNTTGSANTAFGNQALINNISGHANIGIGWGAGKFEHNGTTGLNGTNNCIFIGL